MTLTNKTVVITGGSQGIGAAMADEFAAAGASVLLVARSEDKLAAVAERTGGRYLVADLLDADSVDSLVARCLAELDHIDIWVNNAGIETIDAFAEVDPATIRNVARLNFEAPLLLTRAVLDHMLPRGSGQIVNMSSVAGTLSWPGLAAYCGTKAGLTNFTETLRIELDGTGVGLTVVAPGPVDTDMWGRLQSEDASYVAPAMRRFKTLGYLPKLSPEKVARKVVRAVDARQPYVRPAKRYLPYHVLNNAPRRMIRLALTGTRFDPPNAAAG
ncbi:MAG: SDR family NAD(P)-dependent oxidoreductase [Actinomycetota bacterium]